jgi:hypothetical protein
MLERRSSARAVLPGVACLLWTVASSLAGTPCVNQALRESPSPDGRYSAVVFVRGCREPARFSTQISVIKSGRPLSDVAGNVFVSEVRYADSPADLGGQEIEVRWESADRLVILHPPGTKALKAKTTFKRVRIRYEARESP